MINRDDMLELVRIEQFCNALAAEFLVPSEDFSLQLGLLRGISDVTIAGLALRYHVSREAVLRRMLDRGLVKSAYYEAKATQWAEEFESSSEGGDYYAHVPRIKA
jgi:Zn-dependent peptidase ImmA (M78 family)